MSTSTSPKGQFIPFFLPYKDAKGPVSSATQAATILDTAVNFNSELGVAGTAITYSANYGQTTKIRSTYAAGDWNTHTGGANQAAAMTEMEKLMGTTYASSQHAMRIAAITTIPPNSSDLTAWLAILAQDMADIKTLLDNGWVVLGWINQDSTPHYSHAFTVPGGGGVVSGFPPSITKFVQDSLSNFATQYPRILPQKL